MRVPRKPALWHAVGAMVFTSGRAFGFFSSLSDYLSTVTELPFTLINIVPFIYGAANMVGTILAGKLLAGHARRTIRLTPFALAAVLLLLFSLGDRLGPCAWPRRGLWS